jgi:hypothetical protein
MENAPESIRAAGLPEYIVIKDLRPFAVFGNVKTDKLSNVVFYIRFT